MFYYFYSEEKTNCLSELKNYGVDCNFVTMKTKSGQKLYMCPIVGCGRAYPNIFPLKIHVLQHKNIKPYKVGFQISLLSSIFVTF